MHTFTFITGNQNKADYLSKYLGISVNHHKIELDEIQSLDLETIVRHKVHQAYDLLQTPVFVEDVSLEFHAWGHLPGPFIKWFMESLSLQEICSLLLNKDKTATARCVFGYYDGQNEQYFTGSLPGRISDTPIGEGGYGWDPIFIPQGYDITRGQMNQTQDRDTYLKIKPFDQLKTYLEQHS